ncbi:unnamed protein product [Chironomus riparius]|uniref:Uncharacterized protein n=1 Tax=Chironomus riparius TaxID=315576 RepID=A0A9N9WWR3_9DIPT|nr:unnamed protein product [Chironomus riparius]
MNPETKTTLGVVFIILAVLAFMATIVTRNYLNNLLRLRSNFIYEKSLNDTWHKTVALGFSSRKARQFFSNEVTYEAQLGLPPDETDKFPELFDDQNEHVQQEAERILKELRALEKIKNQ